MFIIHISGTGWRKMGRPDIEKMERNRDVEGLIKALGDEDGNIAMAAHSALCEMGKAAVVVPLIKALEDNHEYVRKNAAFALGCIEDKRAIKQLTKLLNDDTKEVRDTAENAVERIQRR